MNALTFFLPAITLASTLSPAGHQRPQAPPRGAASGAPLALSTISPRQIGPAVTSAAFEPDARRIDPGAAVAALDDDHGLSNWTPERWSEFARVTAASDFVIEQSVRDPLMLLGLVQSGELDRSYAPGELCTQIATAVQAATTEDELARALRRQRNRHQVRIVWRDLTRQADLVQTCRDLSDMADASIDQAYQWLYQRHCQQFGTPTGWRSGEPQQMVILGMGKLGAVELNLSSDIDLIFAYPEGGETVGVKRPLDNQEFFTRLGQRLIKALDPITVDGFVFRVDMRLRPYGSAGALVLSFNALEQYYQDQGRDWERYAMIKARVVGGDQVAGAQLLEMLRPFVYRRYLDFSAIEALRAMKQLIQQEVRRKGMAENIKLGAGGIREVEFIAQAFQLIHGGRDLSLQQRSLFAVLDTLRDQGYLPAAVTDELRDGYAFLRYAEHALQAIDDRQTQMLPDNDQDRARVALIMGFDSWPAFHERLMHWRARVDWHFRQVIADPDEDAEIAEDECVGGEWLPLWDDVQDEAAACRQLAEAGFVDAQAAWQRGNDIALSAPPALWVSGHALLLDIAARNLVENALKHTPDGTHIAVQVGASDGAGAWLQVCDDGARRQGDASVAPGPRNPSDSLHLGHEILRRVADIHGGYFGPAPAAPPFTTCFRLDLPPSAVTPPG